MLKLLAILNLTAGIAIGFAGSWLGLAHIGAAVVFAAVDCLEYVRAVDVKR